MASFHDLMKIQRVGVKHQYSRELYFYILKMPWRKFVLGFLAIYFFINGLFACLYLLEPGSVANIRDASFFDAFAFSSQTFSTVGYGYFIPKSIYAHSLVIFENMAGILFMAIVTGLTFAEFSRPTTSIIFSEKMVVTPFDGVPTLMFRIGNGRDTSLVDTKISLTTLRSQITQEGISMQRFVDLKLERNQSPFFLLTWTVMHKMDESSPFFGYKADDFASQNISLFVSLMGHDETFSETMHTGWIYYSKNIYFGKKFEDVVYVNEKGGRLLDFSKFHEVI